MQWPNGPSYADWTLRESQDASAMNGSRFVNDRKTSLRYGRTGNHLSSTATAAELEPHNNSKSEVFRRPSRQNSLALHYPKPSHTDQGPPSHRREDGVFLDGTHDTIASSQSAKSVVDGSSDRFIPQLRSSSSRIDIFHSSVPVRRLTSAERISRTNSPLIDPFGPASSLDNPSIRTPSTSQRFNHRLTRLRPSSILLPDQHAAILAEDRQVSIGNVWNVAGTAASSAHTAPRVGIEDGRGGLKMTGTNSPLFDAGFLSTMTPQEDENGRHQEYLAAALGLNRASRVLNCNLPTPPATPRDFKLHTKGRLGRAHADWGTTNPVPSPTQNRRVSRANPRSAKPESVVPSTPFRVLDAPELRDDYYCTLLAYDPPSHSLAVALDDKAYIWTEYRSVVPVSRQIHSLSHITSVAFSSPKRLESILAIGRYDGAVTVQALGESRPRYIIAQPAAVSYVSWSPNPEAEALTVGASGPDKPAAEYLLIGDELGRLHFYAIDWPDLETWNVVEPKRSGVSLLAVIEVHTQQICGIAWSPDGSMFATGANDNACHLFRTSTLLGPPRRQRSPLTPLPDSCTAFHTLVQPGGFKQVRFEAEDCRAGVLADGRFAAQKWAHKAAVKAIAFCPWQRGLLATGGGSNDQCIHFFHVRSGACLATIRVAAQVTSLIWSARRREICATFGYAAPDHPFRLATFSWPECRLIMAVPWPLESRALHAVVYAGMPATRAAGGRSASAGSAGSGVGGGARRPSISEGTALSGRTEEEGCIVVASSNESIQFHEVWSDVAKPAYAGDGVRGLLGGSDILESLEGIEKEAKDVLR